MSTQLVQVDYDTETLYFINFLGTATCGSSHFQRHHRHLGHRHRQPIGAELGPVKACWLHRIRLVKSIVCVHAAALQHAPLHLPALEAAHIRD